MGANSKIEDLADPPVVGKWYMVPHVIQHSLLTGRHWEVPVRGAPHRDPEIGVNVLHMHIDERFVSRGLQQSMGLTRFDLASKIVLLEKSTTHRWSDGQVFHKRAKCIRNTIAASTFYKELKFKVWQDAYADAKLLKGHICPHRGFDLTTIPADKDGVKVCPLHGLAWCTRTGNNISRTPGFPDAKPQPVAA